MAIFIHYTYNTFTIITGDKMVNVLDCILILNLMIMILMLMVGMIMMLMIMMLMMTILKMTGQTWRMEKTWVMKKTW